MGFQVVCIDVRIQFFPLVLSHLKEVYNFHKQDMDNQYGHLKNIIFECRVYHTAFSFLYHAPELI